MTTKRKPEDVVLDEAAVREAKKRYWERAGHDIDEGFHASLRTYIAEADLIPRPQTVEEWVEQMPASVWDDPTVSCIRIVANFDDGAPAKYVHVAPRPKPPRMTDEEIDKAAIIYASNCIEGHFAQDGGGAYLEGLTLDDLVEAGSVYHKAYLAERARLEKERGE